LVLAVSARESRRLERGSPRADCAISRPV
jgi:hypothetical protein